jgi:hypothetical protein
MKDRVMKWIGLSTCITCGRVSNASQLWTLAPEFCHEHGNPVHKERQRRENAKRWAEYHVEAVEGLMAKEAEKDRENAAVYMAALQARAFDLRGAP